MPYVRDPGEAQKRSATSFWTMPTTSGILSLNSKTRKKIWDEMLYGKFPINKKVSGKTSERPTGC